MTFKSTMAALAVALMSITSAPAEARVGSDAQGLRQRDAVADPAVKIFRDKHRDKNSYSYLTTRVWQRAIDVDGCLTGMAPNVCGANTLTY